MKRLLTLLVSLVLLCLLAAEAVACTTPGKASSGMTIHTAPINDYAWAQVKKCDCNPVDNNLLVGMEVQYKSGNRYVTSNYIVDGGGRNLSKAKVSMNKPYVNAITASAYAECGGYQKTYDLSKQWDRD